MRDAVTKWRHLSLAGRKHRISLDNLLSQWQCETGIILGMVSYNERQHYCVSSSLIYWANIKVISVTPWRVPSRHAYPHIHSFSSYLSLMVSPKNICRTSGNLLASELCSIPIDMIYVPNTKTKWGSLVIQPKILCTSVTIDQSHSYQRFQR